MTIQGYDPLSKLLHWTMAAVIIYATLAGYIMHLVVDNKALFSLLSTLNISLATIATPLFIVRFIWRFFRNTPELPSSVSKLQKNAAKFIHSLIYLMMFLVFSSGFLMLEKSYFLFWMFNVPNLLDNQPVNEFFFMVHRGSCATLAVLFTLHATAALKHHFFDKDDVLKLMLPKMLYVRKTRAVKFPKNNQSTYIYTGYRELIVNLTYQYTMKKSAGFLMSTPDNLKETPATK